MSGKLTYKQSGVDTKEAAAFVSDISSHVKRTQKQRSLHQAFGLFAAAYDLSSYKEPVIVTGCDGVGTKTEILFELDMVETAGKDLVAMNVNDILTTGGDPLLFLDYLGISNLERERSRITRLVAGMCDYLESCNCILAGGETAEMPGFYPDGEYDIAGFAVGIVDKKKVINGQSIEPGDGSYFNRILLSGALCKKPVLRRTPLGRSICDVILAVNRHYGRADYLPCIAWGQTAVQIAGMDVGERLALEGRVQSRTYTKLLESGSEERTAFEVSIMQLLDEEETEETALL